MARNFDILNMYKRASSAMIKRRAIAGPFDTATAIDKPTQTETTQVEETVPQNTQVTTPVISTPPPKPVTTPVNSNMNIPAGTLDYWKQRFSAGTPIKETNYGGVPREPVVIEQGRLVSGTNQVDNLNANLENARLNTQALLATPQTRTTSIVPSVMDRAGEIKAQMAFSRLPSREQKRILTEQRLAESGANQTAEFQARMKAKADKETAELDIKKGNLAVSEAAAKRAEELHPFAVKTAKAQSEAQTAKTVAEAEDRPITKRLAEVELETKEMALEKERQIAPYKAQQEEAKTIVGQVQAEKAKRDLLSRQTTGMSEDAARISEEKNRKSKKQLDGIISSTLSVNKEGKVAPVSPVGVMQLIEERLKVAETPDEIIRVKDATIQQLDELAQGIDVQTIQDELTLYETSFPNRDPEKIKKMDTAEKTSILTVIARIRDLEAIKKVNTRELDNIEKAKQLIKDSKTVIKTQAVPQVPKMVTQSGIDTLAPGTPYTGTDGLTHIKPVPGQTFEQFIAERGL